MMCMFFITYMEVYFLKRRVYIYIYILYECCSLFYCCVHVVGRLDVYCREAKYGRLVNEEGWGVLVCWRWGRAMF